MYEEYVLDMQGRKGVVDVDDLLEVEEIVVIRREL